MTFFTVRVRYRRYKPSSWSTVSDDVVHCSCSIQTVQAEQLEHRILQQENEISNMENRNYFSLLCVQLETQLIHANLEGLYIALHIMATIEAKSHSEVNRTASRTLR